MWPQSTTQLHANIQLDSLVSSWPSSYVLRHAAYNHNHPQKLWTRAWGILSRESPLDPCWSTSTWGIPVQSMMEAMWLHQLIPHLPFYGLLLYLSSQAIDVAAVTGCIITVRRAPWWHNTMRRIPSSSRSLRRRQRVKAKMAYIQHIFPPCSPNLYLPSYVRNAPCGTRIWL